MTIDAPRGENAFGETIFARPAHVIHDLLAAVLDDRVANALGDRVERFVPGGAFPLTFAAFTGAFERVENAIGIVDLIQRCGTFGAISSTRAGMFGIPLKLL